MILAYLSDDLEDPVASVIFSTLIVDGRKHGVVNMLAAKLEHSGKGVGRLLISACEERAR